MSDKLQELKNARNKKGLSIRKLAKLVGVSYEAIRKYEAGAFPPSDEVWETLKGVLGVSGSVEEYWGREANRGRKKKYGSSVTCKIDGCNRTPAAKGMCLKHYNRERYAQVKKKADAAKEEARRKIRS